MQNSGLEIVAGLTRPLNGPWMQWNLDESGWTL